MENTKVAVENFDWAAFENESGLYNQSKEEIEKAYSDSMSNIAVGEVVEGTVSEINKREVTVNIGYDAAYGARPVKRVIQREVINELSKRILAGFVDKSHPIVVDIAGGSLSFSN